MTKRLPIVKLPTVWHKNDDGSVSFRRVKKTATSLIEKDQVAVQIVFAGDDEDDADAECAQFVIPVWAASELAEHLQTFAEKSRAKKGEHPEPATQTLH